MRCVCMSFRKCQPPVIPACSVRQVVAYPLSTAMPRDQKTLEMQAELDMMTDEEADAFLRKLAVRNALAHRRDMARRYPIWKFLFNKKHKVMTTRRESRDSKRYTTATSHSHQ